MSVRKLFSRVRQVAFAIIVITAAPSFAASTTVTEDFSSGPTTRAWEIHNDASLFVWNSTSENLEVTWDSSKTNSYFRLPLIPFSSENDFSASLDLEMHHIQIGATPGRPSTFQFAFGFQHRASADATNFIRGTGANTPNLAEFNFLPDSGFGPTTWPAMFPTNGLMNYSGNDDFGLFEIPTNVVMRVNLSYTATNHTIELHILTNGVTMGRVVRAPLTETNARMGFTLDAFSISSYSDAGQFPGEYEGSIFARGTIDNIVITTPASPIHSVTGGLVDGRWQHQIVAEAGWSYSLEASADFGSWSQASAPVAGTGSAITLTSSGLESSAFRFFRVKAVRQP
jgi:hypothetical protein